MKALVLTTTMFLGVFYLTACGHEPTTEEKLEIVIYASHKDYVEHTGNPSWSTAGYFPNGLLMSSGFSKRLAVHELTHVLINRLNPNTPRWLNEGIASHIGEDLLLPMSEVEYVVKNDMIPPFSSYSIVDPTEFMNIRGYPLAYSMIEYIVSEYDWDRLTQLILSPNDFEGVFNMSGEEFWNSWKEQLEERFKKK